MKLTQQQFHAQPRRELDDLLRVRLDALLAQEPREDQHHHLLLVMADITLTQTIRNLALPDPQVSTYLLPKRKFPPTPMSFTQLQQWIQHTIMVYSRTPPIMGPLMRW